MSYEQGRSDANRGWWGGFLLVLAIMLAFSTGRAIERNDAAEKCGQTVAEKTARPVAEMTLLDRGHDDQGETRKAD